MSDRGSLLSEKSWLEAAIGRLPAKASLTRRGLEARLAQVIGQLAHEDTDETAGLVRLTFRGAPVDGSRSIDASFGGKALSLFSEAVALGSAGLFEAVGPTGPIPGGRERRLRVVGPAHGSFGFSLELPQDAPKLQGLGSDEHPDALALRATLSVLQDAMSGDRTSIDELVALGYLRAARKLGELVKFTADNDALFAIEFDERRVALPDAESARIAVKLLRSEGVEQREVVLRARLTGLRATKPDFECELVDTGEVLLGAVARRADVALLATLVGKIAQLNFIETRGPSGRPRYVLTGVQPGSLEG